MPHCFSLPPTRNLLVMSIIPLPIYWDVYMVCMRGDQGTQVVIMEGYLMLSPNYEWSRSWWCGST